MKTEIKKDGQSKMVDLDNMSEETKKQLKDAGWLVEKKPAVKSASKKSAVKSPVKKVKENDDS